MADADARVDHILQRCDYDHEGQESGGNLVGARESRPAAAGTGAHRRLASIWTCRYRDWRAHRGGSRLGPERSRGLPSAAKPAGEIDGTLRRNGSHTAAAAKTIEHLIAGLRASEHEPSRRRSRRSEIATGRDTVPACDRGSVSTCTTATRAARSCRPRHLALFKRRAKPSWRSGAVLAVPPRAGLARRRIVRPATIARWSKGVAPLSAAVHIDDRAREVMHLR